MSPKSMVWGTSRGPDVPKINGFGDLGALGGLMSPKSMVLGTSRGHDVPKINGFGDLEAGSPPEPQNHNRGCIFRFREAKTAIGVAIFGPGAPKP